ncbi:MAG: hypothetical protein ABI217_12665 [Chthoniobacterales bacterium]
MNTSPLQSLGMAVLLFLSASQRADDRTFVIGGLDGTLYAFPLT